MPKPATEPILADPPSLPGSVVLRQRWAELAYFHWPYEPDVVQRLLPDGVRVDTFDGAAWVGLIPFMMRNVQLGPTPPVPYLGTFVEINVRTYVIDPLGRRSVWFFSLDVPRSVIVVVARTAFALPYCLSHTEYDADAAHRRYAMTRRWPATPTRRRRSNSLSASRSLTSPTSTTSSPPDGRCSPAADSNCCTGESITSDGRCAIGRLALAPEHRGGSGPSQPDRGAAHGVLSWGGRRGELARTRPTHNPVARTESSSTTSALTQSLGQRGCFAASGRGCRNSPGGIGAPDRTSATCQEGDEPSDHRRLRTVVAPMRIRLGVESSPRMSLIRGEMVETAASDNGR